MTKQRGYILIAFLLGVFLTRFLTKEPKQMVAENEQFIDEDQLQPRAQNKKLIRKIETHSTLRSAENLAPSSTLEPKRAEPAEHRIVVAPQPDPRRL